jgi:1-acyl-sn-glycerol-3-phosphate acyltransferase
MNLEATFAGPSPSLAARLWYDAVYMASATVMSLGFSLRSEGSRHIPRTGPALLIANHQSFFDPVLVGLSTRRKLCYLARKTLFRHRLVAWLIRSLNAVPIDHHGVGKEGIKIIVEQLRAGQAVVVFPEGTRSPDGLLHPLQPGVYLLIKRTQAPIIPVGIAGAFDAWPRWQKLPTPAPLFLPPGRGTIAVSVGAPLDAHRYAELPREQVLEELHLELQKRIASAERLRRK